MPKYYIISNFSLQSTLNPKIKHRAQKTHTIEISSVQLEICFNNKKRQQNFEIPNEKFTYLYKALKMCTFDKI